MSIETYEYRGHTVTIDQDPDAESPREWGHGSTILYGHRRSIVGDVDINEWEGEFYDVYDREPTGWADWITFVQEHRDAICILPVYMFDHSGIGVSTTPYYDHGTQFADSGQVGIIFTTQATIDKNWAHCKEQPTAEQIEHGLRCEVENYDTYLRGDVFSYSIDGPLCDDSLCGMYGDIDDYVKKEAEAEIDAAYEREAEEAAKIDRIMAT